MTGSSFGHEQKPGKVYMMDGDKMLPMPENSINLNEVIKSGVKVEPLLDPEKMGGPIVLTSAINLLASTFVSAADTILDFAIALARAIPKNLNAARKKMKSLIKLKYGKSFRSAKKAIAYYDRLKAREKQLWEKSTSSFVKENIKTIMDNAKIPEGLQQKVLEIEGLKCEENTSEDRT